MSCNSLKGKAWATRSQLLIQSNLAPEHTLRCSPSASAQFVACGNAMTTITPRSPSSIRSQASNRSTGCRWMASAPMRRRQTGFDVTQTFTPRQLGKCQHEELFVSGEFANAAVAVVTGDTLVELVFGQEVEKLGEDGATFVHKVKNRRLAVKRLQGVVAELKSKKQNSEKMPLLSSRNRCQKNLNRTVEMPDHVSLIETRIIE